MSEDQVGHFILDRVEDESAVSGTGIVAEGFVFKSGQVVICWQRETENGMGSICTYTNLAQAIRIHGHNGKTRFKFAGQDSLAMVTAALKEARDEVCGHHNHPFDLQRKLCLQCGEGDRILALIPRDGTSALESEIYLARMKEAEWWYPFAGSWMREARERIGELKKQVEKRKRLK